MCRVGVLSGTGETCPEMPGIERGTRVARGRVCGCAGCLPDVSNAPETHVPHAGSAWRDRRDALRTARVCRDRAQRPPAPDGDCSDFGLGKAITSMAREQSAAWSLCVDQWGRDKVGIVELVQPGTPYSLLRAWTSAHAQHGALRPASHRRQQRPKRMREPHH